MIGTIGHFADLIMDTFHQIGQYLTEVTVADAISGWLIPGADNPLVDLPLLDVFEDILKWVLSNTSFGAMTMGELIFGAGVFIIISFSFIKWLIGIVM